MITSTPAIFWMRCSTSTAAPPAVALDGIGRIGDELQFLQHELRHDERPVEEAGLDDIGDAPVDDDARIEDAVSLLEAGVAEQRHELGGLEPLTFADAEDESQVWQHHDNETVKEPHLVVRGVGPEQGRADHFCDREPDAESDQPTEHVGDGRVPKPRFGQDDAYGDE
jgi:hypothetical protein